MAIADQMMQDPAAQAGVPSGQQPPAGQQGPAPSPEGGSPEADENFVKAVNFARKQLYEKGAGEAIHQLVKKGGKSVDRLATMAYDLTSKADQVTNGMVLDENLIALGMYILGEILEIAEASGAQIDDADIASAFKQMLVRYLQEQGVDTSQLQEAFSKISADDFRKINAQVDKSIPAEAEEAAPEEPEEMPEEEEMPQ